jgi:hypothetical protein
MEPPKRVQYTVKIDIAGILLGIAGVLRSVEFLIALINR